jgi:hypothetical protein
LEEKKLKFFKAILLVLTAVLLLSACGHSSFNTESKATFKAVKASLNEETKKSNKKSGNLHFYLPFGFDIKDTNSNNIILKNGSKTYILFHNPQETSSSDVVYRASVDQYKKVDTKQTFKKNSKLGFVIIKRLEDDLNELTVGIGGTKITIQTKTGSMGSDAKDMMEIVKSVSYKK